MIVLVAGSGSNILVCNKGDSSDERAISLPWLDPDDDIAADDLDIVKARGEIVAGAAVACVHSALKSEFAVHGLV